MDDPPCTQLLLILILHWVVMDDSRDIELLHLLQLEEFSLKFGWSVVEVYPSTSRATCWGSVLGPPKPKTPNLKRYDWVSRASILPHDLPGKFLHFLMVLESTTTLFQDFPPPLKLLLWPSWRSRLPIHGMDLRSLSWLVVSTHLKIYESIWDSSPNKGENRTCLKPPTSYHRRFDLQVHKFERMNGGIT